jgi:hypothetical protein
LPTRTAVGRGIKCAVGPRAIAPIRPLPVPGCCAADRPSRRRVLRAGAPPLDARNACHPYREPQQLAGVPPSRGRSTLAGGAPFTRRTGLPRRRGAAQERCQRNNLTSTVMCTCGAGGYEPLEELALLVLTRPSRGRRVDLPRPRLRQPTKRGELSHSRVAPRRGDVTGGPRDSFPAGPCGKEGVVTLLGACQCHTRRREVIDTYRGSGRSLPTNRAPGRT